MTSRKSKAQAKTDIWNKPKVVQLLEQPVGTPVKLTRDEAVEIVRKAAGRRTDLPSGKEFVRKVRSGLGHSVIARVEKINE